MFTDGACHSDTIPVAADPANRFSICFFGLGVPEIRKQYKFKLQTCEILRSSGVVLSDAVFVAVVYLFVSARAPANIDKSFYRKFYFLFSPSAAAARRDPSFLRRSHSQVIASHCL